MPEPVTIAATLAKLIGFGMAAFKAGSSDGFDEADIGALESYLETTTGLARLLPTRKAPSIAATHLALTTQAFGAALARYWASPRVLTPKIQTAIAEKAALALSSPYDHLPGAEALTIIERLCGDPLNNPYYQALWHACSQAIPSDNDDEPFDPIGDLPKELEREYRRAYRDVMATPGGDRVRRWLIDLADEKAEVMRHILAEDLSAWGQRHVFGNSRDQRPGVPLPFLGLDASYVEPDGTSGDEPARPILATLDALIERHKLVVVQADFGHGKSLTARRLARDVAKEWLESREPATTTRYPVFIKCARDIRDSGYEHSKVVRRALWMAAKDAIADQRSMNDDAFEPIEADRAALLILDGLDEVVLTPSQLEEMFQTLQESLGSEQRAILFTRPGVLHDRRCLPEGTPVIDLRPFNPAQVARWVEQWNEQCPETVVDSARFAELGVEELTRTPILLLMVALTWTEQVSADASLSKAAMYERFFRHIARGKLKGDGDKHVRIQEASARLVKLLQEREGLDVDDKDKDKDDERRVEAMLWLMSRVAWQSHCSEYEDGKELQTDDVERLIEEELGVEDEELLEVIHLGLLLAMQIDPAAGRSSTILFGHQSFREFLVARFWNHQLLVLLDADMDDDRRDRVEARLMASRLLQDEDRAFTFLLEMLHRLDESTRRRLKTWVKGYLEVDEITLTHREKKIDRRPVLREAALAVGSHVIPDEGLELDRWALRYLTTWFGHSGSRARVRAPGLQCPGIEMAGGNLAGAELPGANLAEGEFGGAFFHEADLRGAHLRGANLTGAHLRGANLAGAYLIAADFIGANLTRADLIGAYLIAAYLIAADFIGANLTGAYLSGANLSGANLTEADLTGADLTVANLTRANLTGVDLTGADLTGAVVSSAQLQTARTLEGVAGLDSIEEP